MSTRKIILWELYTGLVPWAVNTRTRKPHTATTLKHAVVHDGARPELSDELEGSVLGGLMQRCWDANSASRPSFQQICRQLELAMKQASGPALTRPPSGPTAAAEGKFSLTLRHDVMRSHKADGFERSDDTKSFGPTATRPQRSAKAAAPGAAPATPTDDVEAWFCNNPDGDVVQMI